MLNPPSDFLQLKSVGQIDINAIVQTFKKIFLFFSNLIKCYATIWSDVWNLLILTFLYLRFIFQTSLKLPDLNISWSPLQFTNTSLKLPDFNISWSQLLFTNFFETSWSKHFLISVTVHKYFFKASWSKYFLIPATVHKLLWNFLI